MTVFSSLHPFTIGYDDVFKHFETLLEHQQPNYPPYNIVKTFIKAFDYTHDVLKLQRWWPVIQRQKLRNQIYGSLNLIKL